MQTRTAFARVLALPENRSALAAVHDLLTTLADGADPAANPLFLHGPPGTGKTLLVGALAEELALLSARPVVCVLSAGDFPLPMGLPTAEGGNSPQRKATQAAAEEEGPEDEPRCRLREARQCDLLIVEDLQRLPLRACETLVQLLDGRHRRRAATVLTASAGPRHLTFRDTLMPARLTTRLAGGLVVGLEPLQPASRQRLLQELAGARGLTVSPEMLAWLGEHLIGGGRQLEGALHQLETLDRLGQSLDPARLRDHFRPQIDARRPTLERIVAHVGDHYRVSAKQLRSEGRSRGVLLPRQVSMYLARRLTPLSLQQIGAHFGGRDHTTVLHACRKVEEAMGADPELSSTVRRLQAELA